jgi:hypothetical protein
MLNFGQIHQINYNLTQKNLKLYLGYPLCTLEFLALDSQFEKLVYTLFVRTAVKINIEQRNTFMEVLSKISKNIRFLENAKLSSSHLYKVNIAVVDLMSPIKLYVGMCLYNYIELLERFGYDIIESVVLTASTFIKQSLTPDHNFIYILGKKIL